MQIIKANDSKFCTVQDLMLFDIRSKNNASSSQSNQSIKIIMIMPKSQPIKTELTFTSDNSDNSTKKKMSMPLVHVI